MKKVLFIALASLLFVACSKEKRIEKNLWKKGGEWNIESAQETYKNQEDPSQNYSETYLNYGTLQFDKDGSGSMTFTDGNSAYSEKITYTNTETELTIFDSEGAGTVFDLDWERNEITLTTSETYTYQTLDENFNFIDVTETYTTTLECEKK
ncbi:hypothetical protein [Brumimicrobium oceani]|uniref:Lipocalin-like domain-containing protein n=1 Tax=Brumimicrobium oceani TaxID=2100725 RepID=A0A2U2XEM6_9FLAO|nr:hypothetical protein [Brumimicrobium oceani]PWH86190.1 hypothetical protein DIT68_06445 [Brumimicrobium oceani]